MDRGLNESRASSGVDDDLHGLVAHRFLQPVEGLHIMVRVRHQPVEIVAVTVRRQQVHARGDAGKREVHLPDQPDHPSVYTEVSPYCSTAGSSGVS